MRANPCTNLGWHKYYVKRFNKNGNIWSCYMAMYYLFLHLRETEPAT